MDQAVNLGYVGLKPTIGAIFIDRSANGMSLDCYSSVPKGQLGVRIPPYQPFFPHSVECTYRLVKTRDPAPESDNGVATEQVVMRVTGTKTAYQ